MGKLKSRLEENGLYVSDREHWELITNRAIYVYRSTGERSKAMVNLPLDVVRHLKLKNKDRIDIAIRRS